MVHLRRLKTKFEVALLRELTDHGWQITLWCEISALIFNVTCEVGNMSVIFIYENFWTKDVAKSRTFIPRWKGKENSLLIRCLNFLRTELFNFAVAKWSVSLSQFWFKPWTLRLKFEFSFVSPINFLQK